ncbi:MAG: isochorismatase family protein [Alphaproteobacteria bacterium]
MADEANGDITARLKDEMPIEMGALEVGERAIGLDIVDEVNGFATVGAGNLAPAADNPQVTRMVDETDRLARGFADRGRPILAFLDTHQPGKPEPPYPPHCEAGTGEEELVPKLKWLEDEARATLVRKDCINGFVGAFEPGGTNRLVDWANENGLEALLVVGICTDVCVMDFVLTVLSARNHGMMPALEEVLVYEAGCATYDLPRATAEELGLGAAAAHPQEVTHYMGLYFMASRGARLVDRVSLGD